MAVNETLRWGDGNLELASGQDGKTVVKPTRSYGDSVTLPERAEVIIVGSSPDWGCLGGVTHFIGQRPPVHTVRERDWGFHRTAEDDLLFGRMALVSPRGYAPSQLPQVLEFVQSNLGWTVDPRVLEVVAASKPWGQ